MIIGILKSQNPRNRKSVSVKNSKFLFVSSMNTLLAILQVTDARRDVISPGGLNHRFPWRHLPRYFCLFSDAEPLRGKISIVKRGKARQEKKIFPETKMKIWSTAKMFFNPFAPEPPVTARADPRPFYPL